MNILPKWLSDKNIRPYVYVRKSNRSYHPGTVHHLVDWFESLEPIVKDPLSTDDVHFANMIFTLESKAFNASSMPMPRWVFYDCAVMPGIVTGFAMRTKAMPQELKKTLHIDDQFEWAPISLFIAIPTVTPGEWVAHNLCSVNSLLAKDQAMYGLGFLSKAFGLWYANIQNLCGVTQWGGPAIKLHCNYGNFELLTAYTPVHTYANTLTYRSWVDSSVWHSFFDKKSTSFFQKYFEEMDFTVEPKNESSIKMLQKKLQETEGPFYLDSQQVRHQGLEEKLKVYRPK